MNNETKILLALTEGKPHPLLVALFGDVIKKYRARNFKNHPGAVGKDLEALYAVKEYYKLGSFKIARSILDGQDTLVRDLVPSVCWAQMYGFDSLLKNGVVRRQNELRELRKRLAEPPKELRNIRVTLDALQSLGQQSQRGFDRLDSMRQRLLALPKPVQKKMQKALTQLVDASLAVQEAAGDGIGWVNQQCQLDKPRQG
jgi:hypothetical protein